MDRNPNTYLDMEPYTTQVMLANISASCTLKLNFLDVGHPEYKSLADQFTSKWQHKKPYGGVKVVDVIKIEVCSDGCLSQPCDR